MIIEGKHRIDDVYETRNSVSLYDSIIENDEALNKFLILDWHRQLKKDTTDDEIGLAGVWKKYENEISNVDLHLANPLEVDSYITNLIVNWNERSNHDLNDIAIFHANFEKIHPFQDGNGRIGRFIIFKQCLDNNIDLVAIDEEFNDHYRKALYKAQKCDDIHDLVKCFEACQQRLSNKLEKFASMIKPVEGEIQNNKLNLVNKRGKFL